ncbi:hypothetical protein D9M70_596950 [compost metagenome]
MTMIPVNAFTTKARWSLIFASINASNSGDTARYFRTVRVFLCINARAIVHSSSPALERSVPRVCLNRCPRVTFSG